MEPEWATKGSSGRIVRSASLNCVFFFAIVMGFVAAGCSRKPAAAPPAPAKTAEEVAREGDELYSRYLEANAVNAEATLLEMLKLFEESPYSARAKAYSLWLVYGRLLAMESHGGDPTLAQRYWIKAQYWHLIERESTDGAPADPTMGVQSFTKESCIAFVEKWDRNRTSGRGAKYLPSLPSTQPTGTQPAALGR
jgi:hypothetical protein